MRIGASTFLLGLALATLAALPSSATTVPLSIDGTATVGTTWINWNTDTTQTAGSGVFTVSAVAPGQLFANNGVISGESGTITNLNSTTEPPGPPGFAPIDFVNFTPPPGGGANLQLWANFIPLGTTGAFDLSPGVLPDTTDVIFNIKGYVLNTSTSQKTDFTGIFSATVPFTEAQLLTSLPVTTGFTGSFSITTIPEPASMLLLGVGLLGVGLVSRKTRRS